MLTADRPETGFITQPDRWSVVVAPLAGVALATLAVQRAVWRRMPRTVPSLERVRPARA